MITAEVETITKIQAEEYLLTGNGMNRSMSSYHVAELIGKQQRGEWVTNGDSIRFDTDGQLRDGQHRLRMVQLTGIPIDVVVIRGLDPLAFSTMDVGKKRSLADVLSIAHEPRPIQLAQTSTLVWRYLSRNLKGHVGSYEEIRQMLSQHPDIRKSIAFFQKLKQPPDAPGNFPVTMSLHYLFSRVDKNKADEFISRYVTGLNARENDPVYLVRATLTSLENATRPPKPIQVFRVLITAFNAFQAGKTVKHYSIQKEGQISEGARIDGFPKELFIDRPNQMKLFDELSAKPEEEED